MGVTSEGVTSGQKGSHWDFPGVLIRADDISEAMGNFVVRLFLWALCLTAMFRSLAPLICSAQGTQPGPGRAGVCAHAVAEEAVAARSSHVDGGYGGVEGLSRASAELFQWTGAYIISLQRFTTPVLPRSCLSICPSFSSVASTLPLAHFI